MSARPVPVPDGQVLPELSQAPAPDEQTPHDCQQQGNTHAGQFRNDKKTKTYALQFNREEIARLLWYFEQSVEGKGQGFDWKREGVLLYEVILRRAVERGSH